MILDNLAHGSAHTQLHYPFTNDQPYAENWLDGDHRSLDLGCAAQKKGESRFTAIREINAKAWHWPKQPIIFIADPHADAQAFEDSLMASGAVSQINSAKIVLNDFGRQARFVIGGDCLDKGPSNLDLLDAVKKLKDAGANVKILAGNHDVRLLMGLCCLDQQDNALSSHMFLRMGAKIVPLLREVFIRYVKNNRSQSCQLNEQQCEAYLFPHAQWFDEFPKLAADKMSGRAIRRELARLREKIPEFKQAALSSGLDIKALYETTLACKKIFIDQDGDYAWFFNDMDIAHREGSFLFLHAGLDDEIAGLLAHEGVEVLNRLYKKQIQSSIFDFYYGAVANTLRTKYRADDDFSLTHVGAANLSRAGIHAVVHGHQNRHHGQRLVLRQSLLHFECDTTLDRHSRQKEGLSSKGFGVTLLLPEGKVLGISSDYPQNKSFCPSSTIESDAQFMMSSSDQV